MIDSTALNAYPALPGESAGSPKAAARFYMKRDPDARMAGSIPVWEGKAGTRGQHTPSEFQTVLNYAGGESVYIEEQADDSFGFGDLVDIVNPLHHIPLVSQLYEGVTGDTIKPSGRIIGGALFGGFAGAAAGIANVIVEEETGKDVAGNVVAMITEGEMPSQRKETLSPEENLNQAARLAFSDVDAEVLPPLAFSLQPVRAEKAYSTQEIPVSDLNEDDRMAGTTARDMNRKQRTIHHASPPPLLQNRLADPASVNLALIEANRTMATVSEVKLSPLPQD